MTLRLEWLGPLLLALGLSACAPFPAVQPGPAPEMSQVPNAVPHWEPKSRYGNPASYTVDGKTYDVLPACQGFHERGIASWYGSKFHGGRTSSGETYDMYAMTAANKVLPLPCYVRVTNLQNGKSAIVKVNDRGPFVENRIIDLSYAAAAKIAMLGTGTALVDVQAVMPGELPSAPAIASNALPSGGTPPLNSVTSSPPSNATAMPAMPSVNTASAPQIFLQVGAFAARNNAESVVQRLRSAGIERVHILDATENRRLLYKVRIGPIPDVNHVDALSDRLTRLGFPDSQVIIP